MMSERALYLRAYRGMRDYQHQQPDHSDRGYWACTVCGESRSAMTDETIREFFAGLSDQEMLRVPGIGKKSIPRLRAWASGGEGAANWVGEGVPS